MWGYSVWMSSFPGMGYEQAPDRNTKKRTCALDISSDTCAGRPLANGGMLPIHWCVAEEERPLQRIRKILRLRGKLAMSLGVMAQAGQYNYGRDRKRGDQAAAWLCVGEFAMAALKLGII